MNSFDGWIDAFNRIIVHHSEVNDPKVQGGVASLDALSLQVILRRIAHKFVALLRKETCN